MQAPTFTRIPSLDGLRAISMLMVVWGHLYGTHNYWWTQDSIWDAGELSVRAFFILSGLIIASILVQEMRTTGGPYLWRIYFRRALRIFLPYYVLLLCLSAAQLQGWLSATPTDFTHVFTYTPNYQFEHNWNLAHIWSLSVEKQLTYSGPRP